MDSPSPEPLPQPKFRLLEGGQRLPRLPRVWTGLWVAAGVLGAAALVMAVLMALDATASARGLALSFASWFLFAGVALLTFAGGMRLVLPWGVWGPERSAWAPALTARGAWPWRWSQRCGSA